MRELHERRRGRRRSTRWPVRSSQKAEKRRWKITHILNTHHHGDHVGGNMEIKKATGCTIVGLRQDRAGIPRHRRRGRRWRPLPVRARPKPNSSCRATPAATSPSAFRDQKALFCGDTLFALGCVPHVRRHAAAVLDVVASAGCARCPTTCASTAPTNTPSRTPASR